MPEMDGLEATRQIHRRWPRDRRPHIVAVTANALQGERELCIQAGMDDYITKPIRIEELIDSLGRAVPRKGVPDHAPAVDRAVIDRLVSSLGPSGEASVGRLLDTFLEGASAQMASIVAALNRGDAEEVRRGAHTLKSNAATFGAAGLADVARDLEALAKGGTVEGSADLLQGLRAEFTRSAGELERIRAELGR